MAETWTCPLCRLTLRGKFAISVCNFFVPLYRYVTFLCLCCCVATSKKFLGKTLRATRECRCQYCQCLRYTILGRLRWLFGQKLVRRDGVTFWSTESTYGSATGGVVRRRRDVLHVHGSEYVGGRRNALSCEAVCFFSVSGLSKINVGVPGDSLTFVLGRWFHPHPSSFRRDTQFRPICPGPFDINHALWQYARSARSRRALVKPNGTPTTSFVRHANMFGNTHAEQQTRLELEKNAYLCVIEPHNILARMNICPEFVAHSDQFDLSTWLETVVLI